MIATQNQRAQTEDESISADLTSEEITETSQEDEPIVSNVENLKTAAQLLPGRVVSHASKSGLNPLVDAAGYLFSVIGKLKNIKSYRQLSKLQNELIQEINTFQATIKNLGYNVEYVIVCRYVLCTVLDDFIANTTWAGQGQWDSYSLLAAFNQDPQQDKFFTIMDRAVKEPSLYIDLMELMYICLSMGYKGVYRSSENGQYQLEQITNNLYKHIRAYRGGVSKILSPTPVKTSATKTARKSKTSLVFIFLVTACVVMAIFICLGYLMDVISNDAYKKIATVANPVSNQTS